MNVVIDTTVFGQGFNARSADVRLLKEFIDRTHAELCVPGIVLDEAVNLVRKSIEEVNAKLETTQRLTGDEKMYSKFDVSAGLTAHRGSIDNLFAYLKARVLAYPTVEHKELVMRALAPNKPFVSGGRGYRDALIWFSLLELAQACTEEISFISDNSDDWCHGRKDFRLHSDYVKDMKSKGIEISRVRFFSSLGQFTQECSIANLPESPKGPEKLKDETPNYQQLLTDRKEWVTPLIERSLPSFLVEISRFNALLEDVELVAMVGPTEIRSLPRRILEGDRGVLQFSAEYKLAVEFSIRRAELAAWSQRLSFHQRRDLNDHQLRVMCTVPVRISFHAIEREEEIEGLSIVSIALMGEYKSAFTGPDTVAVKLNQMEIHAPQHRDRGVVTCATCQEEFGVGDHTLFPGTQTWGHLVAKLEGLLAEDHRAGRGHANLYNLVGPYRID
ncbi:MAG: PIN domain-containing protein [Candidatus Sulfotelmatobacter sp.]